MKKQGLAEHSQKIALAEAPDVVDRALKWLVDGTLWCARCGRQLAPAHQTDAALMGMHWVCFHDEFEHGTADVDTGCGLAGCPAGTIEGVPADEAVVLVDLLTDVLEHGSDAYVPDDRATRESINAVLWRFTSRVGNASEPGHAERVAEARERINKAGT